MSVLYNISDASSINVFSTSLFILGSGSDDRALTMIQYITKIENHIGTIVLIKYDDSLVESILSASFPKTNIVILHSTSEQSDFLLQLKKRSDILATNELFIDMTAIRIPEMFITFKFLHQLNRQIKIHTIYSTPFDYEFPQEPFTSYRSYYGNLKTLDLIGYGGLSDDMSYSQLIMFLGFEGVLSAKVNEDIQYNKLTLVNNLPSFYEKYKDISVINNYELLSSGQTHMFYVPANNPFETYNFLSKHIIEDEPACIAPLSTKPIALGVCLYALHHDTIRVVFPIAENYYSHMTNSVHNTYIYTIIIE